MPIESYQEGQRSEDMQRITKQEINEAMPGDTYLFLRRVLKELVAAKENFQGTAQEKKKELQRIANQSDADDNPAIYWATHFDPKYILLLLDSGADPNKTGQLGITALHQAAYKGKELIVKLLLQRGADANIKDQLDRKPIDMAKEGGYDSIVKLLQPRTTP